MNKIYIFWHFQRSDAKRNASSLMREVAIYVQYDEQVQQVIDEQFLVQCKSNRKQGLVMYGKDAITTSVSKTVTQKLLTTITNDLYPKQSRVEPPSQANSHKGGNDSGEIIIGHSTEATALKFISSTKDPIDKSFVWKPKDEEVDFRKQSASGWMEISPIDDLSANFKNTKILTVGQPVNLVVRIRQSGGRDTMLSSCIAFTDNGREAEAYDLTDYRGCALDLEIMPNFAVSFNSRTSVKRLETSFPMFKFPDAEKVQIKCNVLVCKKNCPVARCDDLKEELTRPQEEFINVSIIDKFLVKTGVNVVDYLDEDYNDVEQEKIKDDIDRPFQVTRGARYEYELPLEPIRRPKLSSHIQAKKSNYHRSGHDVEDTDFKINDPSNVQKSSIIHSQSQHSHVNSNNEEDTGDLLCLSPSRLIIAFGILLVILLLALTASCVLWLKARSALRRPKPHAILTRAQRHLPPPPGTRIVPARPVFVTARTPVPYIRTVQ